ncbi:SDR family oxidoreductase [Pseudomonas aeruginosa]|nr:SDR family oxidoreductase [Pseudomonas aeruginosa]
MHLAWTLSAELLERGIRVNALTRGRPDASAGQSRYRSRGHPGAEGEDWPGRLGEPLEIASAALFLASNEPRCRYGTESLVDGGVRYLKKGAKARSW